MKPKLGFIGLGIMGQPMSLNLLQAGYPLTVYNRTRSKMEPVVAAGAAAADSPREVAEKSDVILTMVSDSPDVVEVILGKNGVLEAAREGLTVIDMSTISPRITRDLAARLQEKGARLLDAPVSGGDKGAREGTLSIMVGGEEAAFEACRPIFEVLGKNIVYIGESGSGQTVKLCNQVACALTLQALSEALLLGARSGVDLNRMLQAISAGAAGSWMLSNLAPKVLARDFSPGFMVKLQQKDLRLVLEAAAELNLPLPGVSLVNQMFRAVEASGGGELGTQALVTALEKLADFEIPKQA